MNCNPMQYARAHLPRVEALLNKELHDTDRRKLLAVKAGLTDDKLDWCAGLDVLVWYLDKLEKEYANEQ